MIWNRKYCKLNQFELQKINVATVFLEVFSVKWEELLLLCQLRLDTVSVARSQIYTYSARKTQV